MPGRTLGPQPAHQVEGPVVIPPVPDLEQGMGNQAQAQDLDDALDVDVDGGGILGVGGVAQGPPPGGNDAPEDPNVARVRFLAGELAVELTEGLQTKLEGHLRGRRDHAAVRGIKSSELVKSGAVSGVEDGLDGFSDEVARDVGAHTDELASGGVDAGLEMTLSHLARQGVQAVRAAVVVYVSGEVDATADDLEEAVEETRGGARAVAKNMISDRKAELAQQLVDDRDSVTARATTQGRNAALAEGGRREAKDSDINAAIAGSGIGGLVDKVRVHLVGYLENKIGAKGARRWRSTQLKAFRGQMKTAGRDEAQQESNDEADDLDAGPATKRYIKMDAGRRNYDPAKESVDKALSTLAGMGAEAAIVNSRAVGAFEAAASEAAWTVLRGDANATEQAITKATKAAKAAKKGIKQEAEAKAHSWKDQLLGKQNDEDLDEAPEDLAQTPEEMVRDKVYVDSVGADSVAASYKANSADEGLSWFGHLVDKAVPTTGESLTVSVEVQIPIPSAPGMYILIGLAGSARRGDGGAMMPGARNHRGDDSMEVNLELRFGAGVELVGLKADASLVFFIRAGADDTNNCMKAMSYGVYRAVSRRSEKLANIWAGSGKGTDKDTNERAEAWAGMMEEQVFLENPDAYAELGLALEGRGKASFSDKLGMTATARGEARNHIDRDRIMERLGIDVDEDVDDTEIAANRTDGGDGRGKKALRKAITGVNPKKQSKRDILEERRQDAFRAHLADDSNFEGDQAKDRRQDVQGEWQKGIVVNGTFTAEIGGQSIGFSGTLSYANMQSWELEVAATITMNLGDANATEQLIAGIIGGSLGLSKTLVGLGKNAKKAKKDKKGEAGRTVSEEIGILSDVGRIANAATGDEVGTALMKSYSIDETASDLNIDSGSELGTKSGFNSSVSLKVALFVGNTGSGAKGGVEISDTTSHSVDISAAGVGINVAYTKSRTLLQAGHDGERSFIEGMGLSSKNV